ncbi:hypothetical protein SAMN05428985_11081 [Nocardioides sp. YR527]|nr:hypothetical protein SAMN05428985_11081 [Nocardioides sp. YR527]
MKASRAPGGSIHDHQNAMKWARRWSRAWNTRYQVRWAKASAVWHVFPTDKPAHHRRAA